MRHLSMPFQVGWDIVHLCNFRCTHCFFSESELSNKGFVRGKMLFDFLDEMIAEGVFHIGLSGGEPLLHPDITSIIERAAAAKIAVSMATNASLLTPEIAARLKRAGLGAIQVSLDGHNPSLNDVIRGKGNFEKSVAGIKNAIDSGIRVTIATVLLKHNINYIYNLFDFSRDEGVTAVKVQTLIDLGFAERNSKIISPDLNNVRDVIRGIWKRKSEYNSIKIFVPLPDDYDDRSDNVISIAESSCFGCEPGLSSVRVDAYGNVRLCGAIIDSPVVGNVYKDTLKSIWAREHHAILIERARALADGEESTSCGALCGKACRSPAAVKPRIQA